MCCRKAVGHAQTFGMAHIRLQSVDIAGVDMTGHDLPEATTWVAGHRPRPVVGRACLGARRQIGVSALATELELSGLRPALIASRADRSRG
jgi:hypothetical protein